MRALKSGAGDEPAETLVGRFVHLFERGLDALSARPARYIIGFFLILASVYSTYSGNISIFGYPIEREYWILGYFIWSLLWRVDSRGAIVLAIGILITCPFLIIMELPTLAEQAAVSVFYFLVIGVIEQIIEYIREERAERAVARRQPKVIEEKEEKAEELVADAEEVGIEEAGFGEVWDIVAEPENVEEALTRFEEEEARVQEARKRRPERRVKPLVLSFVIVVALVAVIGVAYVFVVKPAGTTIPIKKVSTFSSKRAEQKPVEQAVSATNASAVTVVIVNANGIENEATRISEVLKASGYGIGSLETANATEQTTSIYYAPGQKQEAEAIAALIKSDYPTELIEGGYQTYTGDIIVVLGLDKRL